VAQPVKNAEPVADQIEGAIFALQLSRPDLRREGGGRRPWTFAAGVDDPQKRDGVEYRFARRCCIEFEASQQFRKIADPALMASKLDKVHVIDRLHEGADAFDCGRECVGGDQCKDCRTNIGVDSAIVDKHGAGGTKLESGGVKIAELLHPRFP